MTIVVVLKAQAVAQAADGDRDGDDADERLAFPAIRELAAIHAPGTAPIDIADDCSSERTTEKPCSTSSVGTHDRNP